MKGMWYLIKVENENDIGTNEIERWKVVDSNPQSVNIGGDYNYQSMSIKCDKGTPAKKETDSAPTNKSLEERVKSLEKIVNGEFTRNINILFERNETLECETISKTDELYTQLKELKTAFEAECDHYDEEIDTLTKTADIWTAEGNRILTNCQKEVKCLKQEVSELQQAFVKYAICKPTELPRGGEVSPQPPKQSWVNKMNQRIQAAENNVNRRCNKLNQRLQKLESKANGKKGLTAATHITPGEFVYSSSGDIIAYAVPKSTADEWTHGKPTPHAGSTEQADDPKVMTIEEAKRQIKALDQNIKTHSEYEYSFIYTAVIKNLENEKRELEQWIENQKSIPPEPDIVEQIKAGENRLWELRKSVDCVAAIANSASETVSLKEHVIKLMSIHTGLNITGIRMCNKTYKIHYNCKEKGIYVELD